MNIFQKLKKAGYMTDGLTSPIKKKIDPPKKKILEVAKEGLKQSTQEAVEQAVVSGLSGGAAALGSKNNKKTDRAVRSFIDPKTGKRVYEEVFKEKMPSNSM